LAADAQAVEGHRAHRVGERGRAPAAGGAVPLDDGVDQAEQQPRGDHRVGLWPDVAVAHGLGHQLGHEPVEGAPPVKRGPLDIGIAVHPEQQGDVGRLGFEYVDAAARSVTTARPARARSRARLSSSSLPVTW
jgi:hypothetical protein